MAVLVVHESSLRIVMVANDGQQIPCWLFRKRILIYYEDATTSR